jgi:hypothetical protein
LAVGVDRGLFVTRHHFASGDERGELHAVICGVRFVTIVLRNDFVIFNIDCAPTSRARIWFG